MEHALLILLVTLSLVLLKHVREEMLENKAAGMYPEASGSLSRTLISMGHPRLAPGGSG